MSTIESQLTSLEESARQVVEAYENLTAEHLKVNEKLKEAYRELTEKNNQLALLENELKNARVVRGISQGGEETELARAKIGSLVREIDRCIALLNG